MQVLLILFVKENNKTLNEFMTAIGQKFQISNYKFQISNEMDKVM